jgi:hypothetical protein
MRIFFAADIDAAAGQILGIKLEDTEPFSFSVEMIYSDLSGEQRTRTLVTV